MDDRNSVRILLVEDNADFAKLVKLYLDKFTEARFEVEWRDNGRDGIEEAATRGKSYDVILMDYFLPGLNGLEVTRTLQEVMKLGVEDYLVKEEISTPILPKTILGVVEKRKLQSEMALLEIRKKRLEAIQEKILEITNEVSAPLETMSEIIREILEKRANEKTEKYLAIIRDNIERIQLKMEKLKNLKEDKTVQYIKDIKMIDLS
ncbi:MAG: response regulator [Ignavibacteriales bacterium]|nr:response regulator [Ignavibacteriales bacterium]